MLHGCSNKQMDKGSMEKWNPEGTNVTKKEAEKTMRKVEVIVSFDEGSESKEGYKKTEKDPD